QVRDLLVGHRLAHNGVGEAEAVAAGPVHGPVAGTAAGTVPGPAPRPLAGPGEPAIVPVGHGRPEQFLFGAIEVQQARGADPGLGGDIADGRSPVAASGEHHGRRLDDRPAACGGFAVRTAISSYGAVSTVHTSPPPH